MNREKFYTYLLVNNSVIVQKRCNKMVPWQVRDNIVALGRTELKPRYEALQSYLKGVDFDTPGDWDQKLKERIYGR
jgi:hypothetical protein